MSAINFLTLPDEIIAHIASVGGEKTLIALSSLDKRTNQAVHYMWRKLFAKEFPHEYQAMIEAKPKKGLAKLKAKIFSSKKVIDWKKKYSEARHRAYVAYFKTEVKPISTLRADPDSQFGGQQLHYLQTDRDFDNYIQLNPRLLCYSFRDLINNLAYTEYRFIHFNEKGNVSEIQEDYNPCFGMPSGIAVARVVEEKVKAKIERIVNSFKNKNPAPSP